MSVVATPLDTTFLEASEAKISLAVREARLIADLTYNVWGLEAAAAPML
jgi:hypothetical protein